MFGDGCKACFPVVATLEQIIHISATVKQSYNHVKVSDIGC
jgi:hypothetical protein